MRSPLEALQYQRELLDILRSLQGLRQDLMNARTELAGLMGLRPGTPFELADVRSPSFVVPALDIKLEQMEDVALQQRPELLEAHYQQRISAAETRTALMRLLPNLNFTAGAYYDSSDYLLNQDWVSAGAQVSWNLFNVFRVGADRCLTPHHLQIAPHCVADSHHAVFPVWCGDVISSLQILNRFSKRTQPGLGSAKPNEPGDKRA